MTNKDTIEIDGVTYERQLGKIKGVDLFKEDHGILTLFATFKFGAMEQGFGGYCMDTYNPETDEREGHACGTDFILRLINLFEVDRLEAINGQVAYALRLPTSTKIVGLQRPEYDGGAHLLIKDWAKRWGFDE